MAIKKIIPLIIAIIFLFSIFSFALAHAQEGTYLPPELKGIERLQNLTDTLTDEEAREKYLAQEWTKILKANKFVAAIDSFCTRYSLFFVIVFGMPYSLSLTLGFVIVLWLLFALTVSDVTRKGMGFLEGLSYILGIVSAIALAQLQLLKRIAMFLVDLIISRESSWARFIVFLIVFVVIVLLYYFKGGISKALEERRKKQKEEETKQKQKEIKKFTKGLEKGAGI